MLVKTAHKRTTDVAVIKTWRCKVDPDYSVSEVQSLYRRSVRYLVIRTAPNGSQTIVAERKTREEAVNWLKDRFSR